MYRTWLYHESLPKGKIFEDEAEIKKAKEDGWVEAPADIGKKPIEAKWTAVDEQPKKRGRKPKVRKDGSGS